MLCRILVVMFVLTATMAAYAGDARILVTEVKDSRTTGQFFNDLQIKLKLIGDDVVGAKGIRTVITNAVDDTGRNLLKDESAESKSPKFQSLQDSGSGPEVELKLKNPARRSSVVKELSGEVQLFMPLRDPSATVLLTNFRKLAKPVTDPALAKAGIQLTVLSKKEYETLAKQKEQQAAQEAEKQMGQAMLQAFRGMLGAFFQVGENDVILQITDPEEKLINAEVVNANGAVIQTASTTNADDIRVMGFEQPLPADARLRIFLRTQKSIKVVPLKLIDIALP